MQKIYQEIHTLAHRLEDGLSCEYYKQHTLEHTNLNNDLQRQTIPFLLFQHFQRHFLLTTKLEKHEAKENFYIHWNQDSLLNKLARCIGGDCEIQWL